MYHGAQASDERPHLHLAAFELLLDVLEPLLGAGDVAVEHAPHREELQGRARLRLKETVVEIARHADSCFQRAGGAEAIQQMEAVQT